MVTERETFSEAVNTLYALREGTEKELWRETF